MAVSPFSPDTGYLPDEGNVQEPALLQAAVL
jgi:hypothetical protein